MIILKVVKINHFFILLILIMWYNISKKGGFMKYCNFREMRCLNIKEADIILGSVSYDKGASCGKGASLAPRRLRELSGYLPCYDSEGNNIEDIKIYDYCDVKKYNLIEDKAKEILEYNKFMLFFGGDHSVSIPLEKAFYDKYSKEGKIPVIIHLDAHMDILDEYMGSKYSHACPNRRAIDNGYKARDINLIGIRSFEKEEAVFKDENSDLYVVTSSDFRKTNALEIVNFIKNKYADDAVYYVSWDIDIIDPGYAPGTGTPETFGLTPLEVKDLFKEIFLNLDVRAMDIVEVAPNLDANDVTSWVALKMLYEIIYYKFILKSNL